MCCAIMEKGKVTGDSHASRKFNKNLQYAQAVPRAVALQKVHKSPDLLSDMDDYLVGVRKLIHIIKKQQTMFHVRLWAEY